MPPLVTAAVSPFDRRPPTPPERPPSGPLLAIPPDFEGDVVPINTDDLFRLVCRPLVIAPAERRPPLLDLLLLDRSSDFERGRRNEPVTLELQSTMRTSQK